MELTLKEKKFVEKTAETLNPTQAVRLAYNITNPETSTARVIAHQKMQQPKIKQALEELLTELKIDKPNRLKRLAKIFYSTKDTRATIEANKEISKMIGDYAQPDKEDIETNQQVNIVIREDKKE